MDRTDLNSRNKPAVVQMSRTEENDEQQGTSEENYEHSIRTPRLRDLLNTKQE